MYKNQRRKSDRVLPYDIASSSLSNRKSLTNKFISPVINRELTYSATKQKENRSSNLLNTTISDFNHVSMDLDKKETNNQQVNKVMDSEIINNQLTNNKSINKEINQVLINKKFNEQSINKINESDRQLINKEFKKSTNDESNQSINKINQSGHQIINKENQFELEVQDNELDRKNFNQKKLTKNNDDFDSDSEFDKIFEASSLPDKLNLQFPNHNTTTIDSTMHELTKDDLKNRTQLSNGYENDDELFDSDAVITQSTNDGESVNNDTIINDNLFDKDDFLNVSNDDNGKEKIDNDLIDKNSDDNEFDNDLIDKNSDDNDSNNDFYDTLDCTLIYKNDTENNDEQPFIKSQAVPIDEFGCDFKTAAGNKIEVSQITIERMHAKAKALGLIPDPIFKCVNTSKDEI